MKGKFLILFIIFSIFLFVIGYSIYNSEFSKEAIIGKETIKNVKAIRIGMDTTEVINIMGSPMDRREYRGEIYYDYRVPPGSSYQCQIIFNNAGEVIYISDTPDE